MAKLICGKALGKEKSFCSDLAIKAIVAKDLKDSFKNLVQLQNADINKINDLAFSIAKSVNYVVDNYIL